MERLSESQPLLGSDSLTVTALDRVQGPPPHVRSSKPDSLLIAFKEQHKGVQSRAGHETDDADVWGEVGEQPQGPGCPSEKGGGCQNGRAW